MFVDDETKVTVFECLEDHLDKDCISHIISKLGDVYEIPDNYKDKRSKIIRHHMRNFNRYGKIIPSFFKEEYEKYLKPMCEEFRKKRVNVSRDDKLFHAFGVIVIYGFNSYKYKSILKVPDIYKDTVKKYLNRCGIIRPLCCPLPPSPS